MKTCEHCGGDLLRHGQTFYKSDTSIVGIRYICRECRKSFTVRMGDDEIRGVLTFSQTGRPTLKDWRTQA